MLLLRLKLTLTKDFKNYLYGQTNCTLILTWSKASESYFENLGVNTESMKQIGYPKLITTSKKPQCSENYFVYAHCPSSTWTVDQL